MTQRIPANFRNQQEPIIASFTSQDIATGRGLIEFYACRTENSRFLTTTAQACSYQKEGSPSGGNSAQDVDYDATLAKAVFIDGRMSLQLPVSFFNSGIGATVTSTITVYIYKVVGSTETQIATASRALSLTIGADSSSSVVLAFDWSITNTRINKGEKLRLTLQNTATGSAGDEVVFIHDPLNVISAFWDSTPASHSITADGYTKQLKLNIPVRIQ